MHVGAYPIKIDRDILDMGDHSRDDRVLENLKGIDETIMERHEIPEEFFDSDIVTELKEFSLTKKNAYLAYMTRLSVMVDAWNNIDKYDQYYIARLEGKLRKLQSRDDYIDEAIECFKKSSLYKIDSYTRYMNELEDKFDEYRTYSKMRKNTQIDYEKINTYMKKHPDFDWSMENDLTVEQPLSLDVVYIILFYERFINIAQRF